jgi:hypothetical protein
LNETRPKQYDLCAFFSLLLYSPPIPPKLAHLLGVDMSHSPKLTVHGYLPTPKNKRSS